MLSSDSSRAARRLGARVRLVAMCGLLAAVSCVALTPTASADSIHAPERAADEAAPDSNVIAITARSTNPYGPYELLVADADDCELRLLGTGGYYDPALSPEGDLVAATYGVGTVRVFDLEGRLVREITAAKDPAWIPESRQLVYAADRLGWRLETMDLTTGVTAAVPNSTSLSSPTVLPDGQTVVASSADGIVRLTLAGDRSLIPNTDYYSYYPDAGPDGSIAFVSTLTGYMTIIRPGGARTDFTLGGIGGSDISWSVDGEFLWVTGRSNVWHVYPDGEYYKVWDTPTLDETGVDVGSMPFEGEYPDCQPPRSDFTNDGNADLLVRDAKGLLRVYPGNGAGGFRPSKTIGNGYYSWKAFVSPGDWDGERTNNRLELFNDLMTVDSAGRLWFYQGNETGVPKLLGYYGSGWDAMTALIGPGDWDGDGSVDLMARDKTGRLHLYPGTGWGGFKPRVSYGTGWNAMTAIVDAGDWNGDGPVDLLARDATGRLYIYPGNGTGGFKPRVAYGTGWNAMTAITSPGDFNGDGNEDLMARDSTGRLYLYPGNGVGGFKPRLVYGTGWNSLTLIA